MFWNVPWSTVLTRTLVPPFADVKALTMSARPFLTPGSEALLPMDTLPPLAVTFAEPLEPGDPPPQAAMNAARLPYPAIFKMSRRDRSRFRGSSIPVLGTMILPDAACRTRLASLESPM